MILYAFATIRKKRDIVQAFNVKRNLQLLYNTLNTWFKNYEFLLLMSGSQKILT